jgi:hypothetical protein
VRGQSKTGQARCVNLSHSGVDLVVFGSSHLVVQEIILRVHSIHGRVCASLRPRLVLNSVGAGFLRTLQRPDMIMTQYIVLLTTDTSQTL